MEDDSVAQFMSITDQNATVAAGYLSMTEGDVMGAVNMFFENPDIASSFTQQQAAPGAASSSATVPPVPASSRPQQRLIGRQDASGVIHIDDDDDDDDDDPAFDIPDDEFGDEGTALQRIAQESDDAAMAQRLQQEMYGENNANRVADDGVRAPIARTTETLVAPTGYGGGMADDDYGHMLAQMRRRNRPEGKTTRSLVTVTLLPLADTDACGHNSGEQSFRPVHLGRQCRGQRPNVLGCGGRFTRRAPV